MRRAGERVGLDAERRSFADGEEPRTWIDQVRDDEFPLSVFFMSLHNAMAAALACAYGRGDGV